MVKIHPDEKSLIKLHFVEREIYFHVGLSKTGSTFLQHHVFPNLKGVKYIPTIKYRKALDIIPKIAAKKILVSREFDQQFEREIIRFSQHYPDAKPIIVFREPGSWAVSNYKRFVKNAHPIEINDFIDIYDDAGIFKQKDFEYRRYLELLQEHFYHKPLILLYEDLKFNPKKFITNITNFIGIEADFKKINLNPKHVSYSEKSLKAVKYFSQKIPFQKKLEVHRKPLGFLYNLYANILRYIILYGSRFLPESLFNTKPLIPQKEVDAISAYFIEEWNFVQNKAKENP